VKAAAAEAARAWAPTIPLKESAAAAAAMLAGAVRPLMVVDQVPLTQVSWRQETLAALVVVHSLVKLNVVASLPADQREMAT